MNKDNTMKTILFKKIHGNHDAECANLKVYDVFDNINDARRARHEIIENKFYRDGISESFEDFEEEQLNYWAIYQEGDNDYVDNKYFINL